MNSYFYTPLNQWGIHWNHPHYFSPNFVGISSTSLGWIDFQNWFLALYKRCICYINFLFYGTLLVFTLSNDKRKFFISETLNDQKDGLSHHAQAVYQCLPNFGPWDFSISDFSFIFLTKKNFHWMNGIEGLTY